MMKQDIPEKMRVVIDTNVWIGAMVATLCPNYANAYQITDKEVVDYAMAQCEVVFTKPTMEEFRNVATDLRGQTRNLGPTHAFARIEYVAEIQKKLRPWTPGETTLQCRDTKDVMFLKAAQGAKASYIISHDVHILELLQEEGCLFVKPDSFAEKVIPKPVEPARHRHSSKKRRPAWRPQRMEQMA